MSTSTSIQGMEDLLRTFSKLPVALEKEAVAPGVDKAARIMVAAVKGKARRSEKHRHHRKYGHRPGFLTDSISAKRLKSIGSVSTLVGCHKDAFYARFLEKGTSRMRARPFIRPAFQESKGEAEAAAVGIIRENMAKAVEAARKA